MRVTTQKEIDSVLQLDGPGRFEHFIKRVADEEQVWALWNDGWVLMENNDGRQVFPLWPAREYVEMCRSATADWHPYESRPIPLSELIDELLPKMAERAVFPGVFPKPNGQGVTPTVEALLSALQQELAKYE